MKAIRSLCRVGAFTMMTLLGCGGLTSDGEHDNPIDSLHQGLSEVPGCHFYVGSNYGGVTLHMQRGTTIDDLRTRYMGDKISSIRLRGGATSRMWIDSNYRGTSWIIVNDVATFHTPYWGQLGDNASSVDCY